MSNNSVFNFRRFYINCRYTIGINYTSLMTLFILTVIIIMFANILIATTTENIPAIYPTQYSILTNWYYIFLYIIGFKFASSAFSELKNRDKKIAYLMLPSSTLEKYLSRLLMTTVLFIVGYTAAYLLGALSGSIVNYCLFGSPVKILNLHIIDYLGILILFAVCHSIFFAGGLCFKSFPIIKTIAFVFLILVLIVIVILATALVLKYYDVFIPDNIDLYHITKNIFFIKWYYLGLFCIFLPLMCWLTGYFKLKEKNIN